jgi:hypothetical protein
VGLSITYSQANGAILTHKTSTLPAMHQFRSKSPVFWIRISSLSFFLWALSAVGLVCLTCYAVLHATHGMMLMLLSGIGVFVMTWLLYMLGASMCKCPLCRSGPLSSKRCARHRNASRLFGSYRLRVAAGVLFTNHFRCPYCGESTRCQMKKRDWED